MRVLSGVQPSGNLHIGNYLGAIRQFLSLQEDPANECFYFLADLHAMTTVQDGEELRRNSLTLATDFLALGLDPERSVLYRQSDLPEIAELAWMLSVVTPMGLLQRAHSYKDKVAKGIAASHGLFAYPVLMAADILIVRSDRVPVGKDQKQHLEITRDIATAFNEAYREPVLKLPEALILPEVALVPGIDGQKMSKSYGNTLDIFAPEKELRKRVMSVVTDSTPVEAPKPTDGQHPLRAAQAVHPGGGVAGHRARLHRGRHRLWRAQEAPVRALDGHLPRGARAPRRDRARLRAGSAGGRQGAGGGGDRRGDGRLPARRRPALVGDRSGLS